MPEEISSRTACLIEPFTVGCRAARRSLQKQGESALVFGAGTIGIAAAIALKYFGCDRVMICDQSDFRLQAAERLGFAVCNNRKEDLKTAAMDYFGKAPSLNGATADINLYIDAAGAESILELYQKMGKIESRIVMVAVLAGNVRWISYPLMYAHQALIGSGGYFPEDVRDVYGYHEMRKDGILNPLLLMSIHGKHFPRRLKRRRRVEEALNVVIHY